MKGENHMKKILVVLLLSCFVVSSFGGVAFALDTERGNGNGGYSFNKDDDSRGNRGMGRNQADRPGNPDTRDERRKANEAAHDKTFADISSKMPELKDKVEEINSIHESNRDNFEKMSEIRDDLREKIRDNRGQNDELRGKMRELRPKDAGNRSTERITTFGTLQKAVNDDDSAEVRKILDNLIIDMKARTEAMQDRMEAMNDLLK